MQTIIRKLLGPKKYSLYANVVIFTKKNEVQINSKYISFYNKTFITVEPYQAIKLGPSVRDNDYFAERYTKMGYECHPRYIL